MSKTQLAIFIVAVFGITSCKEDVTPIPNKYSQAFTGKNSKTWKLKFVEQTLNGAVEDRFTLPCANDDEYTFYANAERAYKATTGTRKCSADEPGVIDDFWSFSNASATLTMVLPFFSDSSLPFIVREVKKSNLDLEIFIDRENKASYRVYLEAVKEN
jgi:hypothetical protein